MLKPQRVIFGEKISESKIVQRGLDSYIRSGVATASGPTKKFQYVPENGNLGISAQKFWPKK